MEQMHKPNTVDTENKQSMTALKKHTLQGKINLLQQKQLFIEEKLSYLKHKLSLSSETVTTEQKPSEVKTTDAPSYTNIGELLTTHLMQNHLTAKELAEKSGVSFYSIENFLRGNISTKFVKNPESIFKIADILGIPQDEVISYIAKLHRRR